MTTQYSTDNTGMEDLIFTFLLRSHYPKASILVKRDLLRASGKAANGMKAPTFSIVDPDTAEPLAIVEVVAALGANSLKQAATEAGAYASELAGCSIQGFVIRVNRKGTTPTDQIQFYRIWPNSTLERLSSTNFPDLDSLRVSRKLASDSKDITVADKKDRLRVASVRADSKSSNAADTDHVSHSGKAVFLPAVLLLLLLIVDIAYVFGNGEPLISLSHSILATGAASLFTLVNIFRQTSDS